MKLIAILISGLMARGQQRANLRVLLGLIGVLVATVIVFSGIFHLLMTREGQAAAARFDASMRLPEGGELILIGERDAEDRFFDRYPS